MDETLKHVQHFINESNNFYRLNQLENAIAKAEKAHSITLNYKDCEEATIKKIEFNLAFLHLIARNYIAAKGYLDRVKNHMTAFYRSKDLGVIYAHIGNSLTENDDKFFEKRVESYKSSAEMYAKAKEWYQYCLVELLLASILMNAKNNYEALQVAEKVQMACLKLASQSELAQVYNDLAIIYAKDSTNLSNVHLARKLLMRAQTLAQGMPTVEICIYQNLSAVNNRLEQYSNAVENVHEAYALIGKDKPNYIMSDLKYNEGYALYHLGQLSESMGSFELSHRFAAETNQKNVWESLEALATIAMKAGKYSQALSYMERAINIFMINFQRKNTHKKSLIERRLTIKLNQIREICRSSHIRPSKSLTSLNLEDNLTNRDSFGGGGVSQRNILSSRPYQQSANLLDNLNSSSSSEEIAEGSLSDDNNQPPSPSSRTQTQPFGMQEAVKIKGLDSNLTSAVSLDKEPPSFPRESKQEVKSRPSFNQADDSNKLPALSPNRPTESSLPSIFSKNRNEGNWSRSIFFEDDEPLRHESSQPNTHREETTNSYSDGRRVFDPFSSQPKTPVLANSTLEFGASKTIDDEEISSNIAESDKPDRELVEDYKKVMFDEEKRLNAKDSPEPALTLSQLNARSRDLKESTFGSTYVVESTSNTTFSFGGGGGGGPASSRQIAADEATENERKRIHEEKLDLDKLAERTEDLNDKFGIHSAPETPKTPKQQDTSALNESKMDTNRSMESNKSYKLSRASSSKRRGSTKMYQNFNRGIVPVENGLEEVPESKKSSKICTIS